MKLGIKPLSVIGVSLALALVLLGGRAKAGTTPSCTVTSVFYDPGRLDVLCDGVQYYTNPGGTCHTASIDDVKVWYSIAMAAYLSGKRLGISFEDPSGSCGNNTIWSLQIQN